MLYRRLVCGLLGFLIGLAACGSATPGPAQSLPTAQIHTPSPAPAVALLLATPTSVPERKLVPPTATATPPQPFADATATLQPTPESLSPLEAQLFMLVNALRAEQGLPAYQHLAELSAVARAHSCDIAAHQVISHSSSDGRSLTDRIASVPLPLAWPSESVAAGTTDPQVVIAMWMDEPPEGWHRRNLLDPDQQVVGIGYCQVAEDATGNYHYWTMDIARYAQ